MGLTSVRALCAGPGRTWGHSPHGLHPEAARRPPSQVFSSMRAPHVHRMQPGLGIISHGLCNLAEVTHPSPSSPAEKWRWDVPYRTVVLTGKTLTEALTLLLVQKPQTVTLLWSPGTLALVGETEGLHAYSRLSEQGVGPGFRWLTAASHVHCIPSTPGSRKVALIRR